MSKNSKNKSNINGVNKPSYSIPVFGYKSSFFILLGFIVILFTVPSLFRAIWPSGYILGMIISAVLMGFIVCYAQFFIQSKKGFTRNFVIVWFCLSVLFLVMLFFNLNSFL